LFVRRLPNAAAAFSSGGGGGGVAWPRGGVGE